MTGTQGVRRAMSCLHHKTSEQRRIVEEMRKRAEALTASGRASAKAKHIDPPPLCFVEVAGEGDLKRTFPSDGMLSGVAVGVSDALDVCDFRTRYGADSQLLHQMPHTEFSFVSWLRLHGAQFIGKLACLTPLTMDEASIIAPGNPAAVAVHQKACNYAISSALMGPAAMTSPVHYDVAAFKPTSQSFATCTGDYHLVIPSMSIGITAARLDDIFYLWEVFTSAIQPSYFNEEEPKESKSGGGVNVEFGNNKSGNIGSSNATGNSVVTTTTTTSSSNNSFTISSSSNSSGISTNNYLAGGGRRRNSYPNMYNNVSTTEDEIQGRHIVLSVGYPADWIDALCKEHLISADEFRRRILCLATTQNAMRKNEVLEVIPLTIDIDMEAVVKAIKTISLFELSEAFDHLYSPVDYQRREIMSSSPKSDGTKTQSGLLDELPDGLVSAIFYGRSLTTLDYHRALRTRDSVVRATDEQFRDIDLIITPLLSEPYVNGSMRSIAPILPYSLGGNPMVSVQLEPGLPVALIGELGRDTGLFEDCTTFLQFVRGTSPRWWRRKFMQ